jgi:hypothetical protein
MSEAGMPATCGRAGNVVDVAASFFISVAMRKTCGERGDGVDVTASFFISVAMRKTCGERGDGVDVTASLLGNRRQDRDLAAGSRSFMRTSRWRRALCRR